MKAKVKIWLESDGKIFGKGNYDILNTIDKIGSISASAKVLNMSYKKAWNKKNTTEELLGGDIFTSNKGAGSNSGTKLNQKALDILNAYSQLEKEVQEFTEKRYKKLFKDIFKDNK